jgi:alpha-L-rhamnosidase
LAIDAVIPRHAPVPSDLVGTAYFARTCGIMAQVAGILNRSVDREEFLQLQKNIISAFRREFVTANGRIVGDCQTSYLLALAFDLLPESQRKAAVEALVELIRKRDWHLSTGFVGTPLLCPVLSRFGRHDVAMKLLLQDTYPSWLFPVKNGATTMWERWNSYTPENGFGDVGMNSFNHYAYGAIGEWMVHYVAGIAPGEEGPAYQHILFRPQLCEGLDHASATLETPYGQAGIRWESKANTMKGEFTIPPNAFADFQPGFSMWKVTDEIGKVALDSCMKERMRLASGRYRFFAQFES